MKKITVFLILLGLLIPLGLLKVEQRERRYFIRQAGRITYIPKPETLKHMSLGYDNIMGDLIWIRAIQYYGSHFSSMQKHPEDWQRLADALLELRPHFVKGITFVGVAMAEGSQQPEQAIEYLDRAHALNPGSYELPYNAAMFAAMTMQDKVLAAEYMCKAAETNRVVPADITVSDNVTGASMSTPLEYQLYPRLYFKPGKAVVPPDAEFRLDLRIADTQAAATTEYNILFDPKVVNVLGVEPAEVDAEINNASGLVEVSHTYKNGIREEKLITVRVQAVGTGRTTMTVEPLNFRRSRDGWHLDLRAPLHLGRLCNAYRTETGEWYLALIELQEQQQQAHLDVERAAIQAHVNRLLVEIDTKVLNHLVAAWMDSRGKAPENLEALLGAEDLRGFLVNLSQQVQQIVNQVYSENHPEVARQDLIFRVWEDEDLGREILREYPALWSALTPFFEWWYGRPPKDPSRTDEDIPEMVDVLRNIYEISLILNYRYAWAYGRPPASQEELVTRGFQALTDPNNDLPDKPEDRSYEYRLTHVNGEPVVRSTYDMHKERDSYLAEMNRDMQQLLQRVEQNPVEYEIPGDITEFYSYFPTHLNRPDPFGEDYVIDPDTLMIMTGSQYEAIQNQEESEDAS